MERRNSDIISPPSSSPASSTVSSEDSKCSDFSFKDTELRLGLPGSQSPERKSGLLKNLVSGSKRVFSDAINGSSANWVFSGSEVNTTPLRVSLQTVKEGAYVPPSSNPSQDNKPPITENAGDPFPKAQVVGWPPIRSFRKNTMSLTKNSDETEGKQGSECLYVKVSMEGAPYLRKVDLKLYENYCELSSALEKMFSCFTLGQCGTEGLPEKERLSESHLKDFLHGSEYVLTYEDKDGDWMLVGDVPWEMFTDSCRRLRIMKGSEAIGLAPRAIEKCKNRN